MRTFRFFAKRLFLTFLTLSSAFFFSCGHNDTPRIYIGDTFQYWEADADSTFGDAMKNTANFKPLQDKCVHNLWHTLGKGRHYVWVRAEFTIPPQFKNQPLGLVIPHLRFAEQVFCNGAFISQYGAFPPHEQSTLFKAHFFSFPLNVLNQEGKNIILIKIFAQGRSGISSYSFVQPARYAYPNFETLNFHHTRIYMFLVGILFLTFILYLSFYLNLKSFKEFRDFAFVNFFTSIFLIPFFATELPMYTNGAIPYVPFIKLTLCIPPYFMVFFASMFAINFLSIKPPLKVNILRWSVLVIQVLLTLFAPNYEFLINIFPLMIILLTIQGLIGAVAVIKELIGKEKRMSALYFATGFLPLSSTIVVDFTLRITDNTRTYTYFSIFGWQISIIIFIVMLAFRFATIYKRNERLSNHLKEEVAARTSDLQFANNELSNLNERLEKDKHRSDMDLEMASIVQRKFLPKPNKHFRGWEVSVCYSPQAKVSGDFYDYYSFNDTLNGITLFDVSGHGLSASLVTMLSKNIISRVFQTGFRRKEPVDKILNKINNLILAEKGDIENYMTGVLCRFDDSENPAKCKVELGNAGHPYPLKYSVSDNEIYELKGNDGKQHYGAIGMKGITVSFARSNFFMSTGDILLFYTDGLTESTNSKQEQFGLQAIKEIIKKNHAKSSDEILGLIMERLDEFTEYRGFEDDLTVIIAKRKNVSEYVEGEDYDESFDDNIEELEEADTESSESSDTKLEPAENNE